MERRLYKGIMMPSFVLATSLGFWLIFDNLDYYLTQTWLHIKLLFAICLIAYHFYCGYLVKIFYSDKNVYSAKFYRWFNEIPTLILIIMVVLAVVKPF
jgi:putative membrane protein